MSKTVADLDTEVQDLKQKLNDNTETFNGHVKNLNERLKSVESRARSFKETPFSEKTTKEKVIEAGKIVGIAAAGALVTIGIQKVREWRRAGMPDVTVRMETAPNAQGGAGRGRAPRQEMAQA
jgi:DNA gyrase/topoisomerase IV subunit A